MRIAVVSVAAEIGGALTILDAMADAAERSPEHEWLFLVSKPVIAGLPNRTVIRFPWVKRSLGHRAWFDMFVAPRILRQCRPDVVLSLHNVPISRVEAPQVVYMHQALPFSDFRFRLMSEPKLWLYEKLTRGRILRTLKHADAVIVQAQWLKPRVVELAGVPASRVAVVPPSVPDLPCGSFRPVESSFRRFFYPAAPLVYKNHQVIFRATERLLAEGLNDFEVSVTLSESEFGSVYRGPVPSNVVLLGRLTRAEVAEKYAHSVMIFPSVLETAGLPLTEASRTGSLIIAADLPYAREALAGYPNALFFDPNDDWALSSLMKRVIFDEVQYVTPRADSSKSADPWRRVVELLEATAL